jgi:hypothetical protein
VELVLQGSSSRLDTSALIFLDLFPDLTDTIRHYSFSDRRRDRGWRDTLSLSEVLIEIGVACVSIGVSVCLSMRASNFLHTTG